MKTAVTDLLGIDLPIFAFSHCRDVVVEVSKAGGMGVLGAAGFDPEHLEEEMQWIDSRIGGKPYGVDVLIPNTYAKVGTSDPDLDQLLPQEQRRFVQRLCDDAGLPPLPVGEAQELIQKEARQLNMTPEQAQQLLDVAVRHKGVKLIVNALGTPPREQVARLKSMGFKVGSLIGKADHVKGQLDAGVDLLVAQGTEAGGHTGSITSMVLWPQIVDLAGEVPVLAAGGIGRGKQMAAALVMGAAGVWCGSIWLGTRQSEVDPLVKERFYAAKSEDAIQTRALTGKPCRALRSKFLDAWEVKGAPSTLMLPLQTLVGLEARLRAQRGKAKEWMTYPVGQIVGDMTGETSVRDVVQGMLEEFLESVERLNQLVAE
jgi:NAD(P)H-dependent flavin oxidoreductase YrpB (nitropropane dioxygenase family)